MSFLVSQVHDLYHVIFYSNVDLFKDGGAHSQKYLHKNAPKYLKMSDSLLKPGLYKWKRQTDPKVYSRSQVYTLIMKGLFSLYVFSLSHQTEYL